MEEQLVALTSRMETAECNRSSDLEEEVKKLRAELIAKTEEVESKQSALKASEDKQKQVIEKCKEVVKDINAKVFSPKSYFPLLLFVCAIIWVWSCISLQNM